METGLEKENESTCQIVVQACLCLQIVAVQVNDKCDTSQIS